MIVLSKWIHKFNTILIKISLARYFVEIVRLIIEFIWNAKDGHRVAKTALTENKVGEPTLPNFRTC